MIVGQLLFTNDRTSAEAQIEEAGGRITHSFSEAAFVVNLPGGTDIGDLASVTRDQPVDLDEGTQVLVDAWIARSERVESAAAPASQGLAWDTPGYDAPLQAVAVDGAAPSATEDVDRSTGTPTSLYMTGRIAVGVVVVSGESSELAFTNEERATVVQEVQEGLDFLANAEPRARITWVYDVHFEDVTVQSGSTSSYESAESPWRNAALENMGFDPSRSGSIAYVQNLRSSTGSDWAYAAYFTKYPLKWFAYAGDERTVMHYGNDGWGTASINRVFAHESCHIFGAADEYGSCSCGGSHGHLGIPNNNCTNCDGDQEPCLMNANTLEMCQWSRRQIGWDERLFPGETTWLDGVYTLVQTSSGRFLDAYENGDKDWSVVTRTVQTNDTQRWRLTRVGLVCTVEQKSSGRFLDAFESDGTDWSVVTRPSQDNDTQRWVLLPMHDALSTYTIQQLSSGRYLDAHTVGSADFSVVTRTAQSNDSQRWLLTSKGADDYTIQQVINGRYVDAYETSQADYSVVTRLRQGNDSQKWTIVPVAAVYTISQVSSGRLMDAYEIADQDFDVVTRTPQHNDTQQWVLKALDVANRYTIQQLGTARYLDAYETSRDHSVVTRNAQKNDTQRWMVEPA